GVLNAGADNVQVRVGGQFTSMAELRAFPIRGANPMTGQAGNLRLGDLAQIKRAYVDPPAVQVRHQGKQVIAIGVVMAKGGNIIALGKALNTSIANIVRDLP